ncbi:hypothetical protein KIW84_060264 [Lathyrus oleraceus]|uniref:Uncharacterized protein n=1 Tax=Pisum sativum TaxID=3888 RepID=A0A9D4VZM1_PEA|nr:hypothetical protein KIW84_060264 [Pisum sativum]
MDDVRCQALSLAAETVKVENAIGVEKEKKPSISSYKQALEVVRNGGIPGWGQIMGIVVKADMFGIGYRPGQDSSEQNRGRRPSFTFVSAGMLDSDHAYTVGEETDSDWEIDQWIKSNQAEEEGEEDCDLLELTRLLRQEEKVIQPHEERIKIVFPSTAEVRKEIGK